MGMSDIKIPYQPVRKRIRCIKCGNEYYETLVRECHHPAVIKAYGKPVNICLYCCKKKPCPKYRRMEYTGVGECEVQCEDQTKK